MLICKNQKSRKLTSKDFKSQEIFVKQLYEFPCAYGIVQFPNGARPSPLAEGNFEQEGDDESAEGDKKDGSSEVAWSTNGDFIEAGATALLRQLKNYGRHYQRRLRPLWPSVGCESAPRRSSLVRPPPHRQHVPPGPHCWHSPYYLRWFVLCLGRLHHARDDEGCRTGLLQPRQTVSGIMMPIPGCFNISSPSGPRPKRAYITMGYFTTMWSSSMWRKHIWTFMWCLRNAFSKEQWNSSPCLRISGKYLHVDHFSHQERSSERIEEQNVDDEPAPVVE